MSRKARVRSKPNPPHNNTNNDEKRSRKAFSRTILNPIVAKTPGQEAFIEAIKSKPIVICDGPAGSGKSLISFGYALKHFVAEAVSRIIVVRPTIVSSDEPELGYLPGTLNEKMSPFIAPLMRDSAPLLIKSDVFGKMNMRGSGDPLESLLSLFNIEIVPLHLMRGRTFNDSFIILDEAQNCTMKDFKLFLTRIGENSRVIIEGDSTQKDRAEGALPELLKRLDNHPEIAIVKLGPIDIVRNPIIADLIRLLD